MRLSFFVKTSLPVIAGLCAAAVAHAAGPSISTVFYPSDVTANIAATLSASVSAASGVNSCNLYVDSQDIGAMALNGSSASLSYTFPRGGVFTVFVFCKDNAGGMASGANTSVLVAGQIVQTPTFGGGTSNQGQSASPVSVPTATPPLEELTYEEANGSRPKPGSLVKLACADGAPADDPCKAVYYVDTDGKRRAFPNDKAYFTWYRDFNAVVIVTPAELSALPLGKNVTYRPGIRLVKFQTLNRVYAVTRNGMLRWVTTEDAARGLYGEDWNKKVDDISDAFYANYSFGTEVNAVTDYNPEVEIGTATAIEE
jgi:hypothetical protein